MSTVQDILKDVKRFRILVAGRAGVGKSSIINRVFHIDGVEAATVEDFDVGEAEIDEEFFSPDNPYFVSHDSRGFELGSTNTLNIVRNFILRRSNEGLPLKDRLHAVWLCTETPRAGEPMFQKGDENLLELAHQTQTPIVVVFTKYDLLVGTKKTEMRWSYKSLDPGSLDKSSKDAAKKELDDLIEGVKGDMQTPMPRYAKVSTFPGYDAGISSLVDVTGDLVREKLKGDAVDAWMMWAIAQRASLPLKIDACLAAGMVHFRHAFVGMPGIGQMLVRDLLVNVHQDIVTCWNFRDKENILGSEGFKQLILLLVQDVEESQDRVKSDFNCSQAIDQISQVLGVIKDALPQISPASPFISLAVLFVQWLSATVSSNKTRAQRLLMTYSVDLTAVLRSSFDFILMANFAGRIRWLELKEAFDTYEHSGSRKQIHSRIGEIFHQDQQFLDTDGFQRIFRELVTGERGEPRR